MIDLFDFDPRHLRAGIGIVISEGSNRNKGYGSEALSLICAYGFRVLGLHQVYAGVGQSNTASLRLFRKHGFREAGIKQDWIRTAKGYENEILFQKINGDVH
jgi:diamine N-acetyltransferase